MDSERLRQIEEIYHAALEIPAEARDDFFKIRCGTDKELRHEVEALLSFESSSDNFIDHAPVSLIAEIFTEKEAQKNIIDRKIGHYTIKKLLGKGGMGEVFLADDEELGRLAAIKVLSSEIAADAGRIRRFIGEARAASALNHPNILTIYEIGEFDGWRFMASEFVEGQTLGAFLHASKPNLSEVLKISVQIVSALQTAHEAGIIHRDIKPENVMIRRDGIVKVLDFGLAKLIEKPVENDWDSESKTIAKNSTMPGMIMGTPNYMSPEQARGRDIDRQTDIFSFGVCLYEMLSGTLPFQGDTASDIIASVLMKEPKPLHELNLYLPPELEEIVRRSLEKDKQNRYQSAKLLLADLEQIQKRLEFEERFRVSPSGDFTRNEPATQLFERRATGGEKSPEAETKETDERFETPNNLSGELARLIGREAELKKIADLIRQKETRLLTLTGVGGTGKTRLAKEVAQKSLTNFTDGVFFVDLSAIADVGLVEQAIAQTLGVKETDSLKDFLAKRKILLVLDNFEQITEAAPNIGELLADSANLKILITSRVRLNLSFEREFTLQPLEIPVENDLEIAKIASVALFVERAKAVKAGFDLTEENSEAVAEICRQLDGLPLAIELAAVQVKLFAPKAIKKRLENSLQILTSGARDLPARQRTMRDAIAWSYDLLEEDEKCLFNRIFVFRGGFTLDSAEAVANADGKLNIFNCLSSLIDKSLLVQTEQPDGEPRFKMLQVVREFAREEPEKTGEDKEIRNLHVEFFVRFAESAMLGFRSKDAVEFLDKTEVEHDNLRLALEWSLLEKTENALRIAGALPQFWIRRGHLSEGANRMREALKKCGDDANPQLRARALCGFGNLSWNQGNMAEAEQFFEKSLSLSHEIGDQQMIAVALDGFGIVKMMQGDFSSALKMFEEGLEIATAIDDRYEIARLANCLGEIFRTQEDYENARRFYEQSLSMARQESFKHLIQLAAVNLSAVACLLEDYEAAKRYALETLKLAEEAGDKMVIGFALERFLALAVADGAMEKAARLFGALEKIYESIGYKIEGTDEDFLNLYLDKARAAIGEDYFNRAKIKGRAMPLKKAVALALETK